MTNLALHSTKTNLEDDLTERLAGHLREAILARGEAAIALSGGSTPGPIYQALSRRSDVDWRRVSAILVDERITPAGDPASNAALIKSTLIQNQASAARFIPLTEDMQLPELDAALLGMGSDGHFASLFPHAEELSAGLRDDADDIVRMTPNPLPANAPFPRLSMSLPAILRVPALLLAISGAKKKEVFEEAASGPPTTALPISFLLCAEHANLHCAWAP